MILKDAKYLITLWDGTFTHFWSSFAGIYIKQIGMNILPDTAYHVDELKSLIKTHHSAFNIDFGNIIRQLITNQVIVQNKLNDEYYYKYGSTPF
jgi:hypothetical protein